MISRSSCVSSLAATGTNYVAGLAVGGAIYAGGRFSVPETDPGIEFSDSSRTGLAVFHGAPSIRLPSATLSLTVTVGDTTSGVLPIRNIGLETLTVSRLEASSPRISFIPSAPFGVAPGSERAVTVVYEPREPAARASAEIRIT